MFLRTEMQKALKRYEHETVVVNVAGTLVEIHTVTDARGSVVIELDPEDLSSTLEQKFQERINKVAASAAEPGA